MSKIYIAGKVSGIPYEQVLEKFAFAEKEVASKGAFPVSPVRFCKPEWNWNKCMRNCIRRLMECDGIYMLKDWKQSKGAKLEHFIALKLGMTIEIEK